MADPGKIFIVDDEQPIRESLTFLLKSIGLKAEEFDSAQGFLENYDPTQPGCLLLDVRMPEMNGLELQKALERRNISIPIILISAHADVEMAVRGMEQGAVTFLEKPFRDQDLLDAVSAALEQDGRIRSQQREMAALQEMYSRLTARECEILQRVVAGDLNKVIASDMGLSQKTVEFHRSNIMHKLNIQSIAELVRFSVSLHQEAEGF